MNDAKINKFSAAFKRALEYGKHFHYHFDDRRGPLVRRDMAVDEVRRWTFAAIARVVVRVELDGSQEEANWTIRDEKRGDRIIRFKAPTPERMQYILNEARELRKITKPSGKKKTPVVAPAADRDAESQESGG